MPDYSFFIFLEVRICNYSGQSHERVTLSWELVFDFLASRSGKVSKVKLRIIVLIFVCVLIGRNIFAEDNLKNCCFFQITTTSIGDGFLGGFSFEQDWQVGVQFTSHSGDTKEIESGRKYEIDDIIVWTLQRTQVLVLFGRWLPLAYKPFYIQGGLSQREQIHKLTYVRWRDNDYAGEFSSFEIHWPKIGMNFGVGFNWTSDTGLSGGIGYGLLISEKPKIVEDKIRTSRENEVAYYQEKYSEAKKSLQQQAYWPMYSASLGWSF